jgi:hypothetical protein
MTCTPAWEALVPAHLSVPGVGAQLGHAWPSVGVSPVTGACTRDLARHGAEPLQRSTRSRPVPETPSAPLL